jgi:hypothetical protein
VLVCVTDSKIEERVCVCVCVCVREKEKKRFCVTERVSVFVNACMCLGV